MRKKLPSIFILLLSGQILLHAQWTNNLMQNTPVSVLSASVTPMTATMNNGFTYVSYYWPDSNLNYTLFLQLLDTAGNKLWGANGVAAGTKPSGTSVSLYDLKVDNEGNAILGAQFIDTVSYTDSVFVTKISPQGTALWGNNGVTLGAALSPVLCVTPENNIIVAARGGGLIWRLTSTGSLSWAKPDTLPASVENLGIIGTSTEDFILEYFKAGNNFQYGILYGMKYDSSGTQKWANPVQISDQTAAVFDRIHCIPDGRNGLFTAYTSYSAFNQDGFAQHISASGDTLWGTSGLEVSTDASVLKFISGLVYSQVQNDLYVIESVTDLNQNYYGVKVQRIDSSGAPKFTPQALQTEPLDSAQTDGGIVLENDGLVYMYLTDSAEIKADKIDFNGNRIWQRYACTQTSAKLNPSLGLYKNYEVVLVWEDDRNNTSGIYAQSFIDTLAKDTATTAIFSPGATTFNAILYPNPSNGSTLNIRLTSVTSAPVNIRVVDLAGNEIYSSERQMKAGFNTFNLNMPAIAVGMYLVQLQSTGYSNILKWVCSE